MKQSIVIIGAGAAGLMAANELAPDFDVTILEANNRSGGRIQSILMGGEIIEAGAEFIHGKLPLTLKLLKKAGMAVTEFQGKMYREENGRLVLEENMLAGWDELLSAMKSLDNDMPLKQFLETYFKGDELYNFRKNVTAYAEGFDLADCNEASTRSLYNEWKYESEQHYRIPTGYYSLVKYLEQQAIEKGCRILFNKKVSSVHWEQNDVMVYNDKKEQFYANKLLVTVPLPVLQQKIPGAGIVFKPAIPVRIEAASNIRSGSVIKIVFQFKNRFWPTDVGFIFSDEKYFPTWWTKLPESPNILTGWMGGPVADEIAGENDETISQLAFHSLSRIFDIPSNELKNITLNIAVFNWTKTMNAFCGYSYDTIDSNIARKIMNTPLMDTIFFAGEALYKGKHPGTVEAALLSGEQTAKIIKEGNYKPALI